MIATLSCRKSFSLTAIALCLLGVATAAEPAGDDFQKLLTTAGMGPEKLASLAADSELDLDDWQLLAQLVFRLEQFSPADLSQWVRTNTTQLGELVELSGNVTQSERVPTPEGVGQEGPLQSLYRCQLLLADGSYCTVLTPHIPRQWIDREVSSEPVRLMGIVLGAMPTGERLFVTNHLAWHPRAEVPTGWILLANQGMDVSLLDEVRHRQPFVKPEVSREGEAFYQSLAALAKVDPRELAKLALANVDAVTQEFIAAKPAAEQLVAELKQRISTTQDPLKRETLQQELSTARRNVALAEAVVKQGRERLSSVAPLFLEPERQMGELVRIEGVARRAVRIATDSAIAPTGLDAYYELEVFTPDSQNLPVVCCVARVPEGFSLGDAIHEPVRVDGVFFKCWRYRSRKNLADTGQTGRLQQLYTPIVVGGEPRRLPMATVVDSRWGLWGGIGFLVVLAAIWIALLRVAERDRRRRIAQQPVHLDLPEQP